MTEDQPWRDTGWPTADPVTGLLAAMPFEEKVALADLGVPPLALVGIARVRLEPGDATPVLVEISVRASARESRLSTTITFEASEGHAVHS
jgi:hypothetical protein